MLRNFPRRPTLQVQRRADETFIHTRINDGKILSSLCLRYSTWVSNTHEFATSERPGFKQQIMRKARRRQPL